MGLCTLRKEREMLKRILGLCECPGCMKIARREMIIKRDNRIMSLKVCEECAWVISGKE